MYFVLMLLYALYQLKIIILTGRTAQGMTLLGCETASYDVLPPLFSA